MQVQRATNPSTKLDRNSCTVIALSTVCELDYHTALNIATEAGRRRGKGFQSAVLIGHVKKNYNFRFREHLTEGGMSLGQFTKRYPTGRFYVRKKGHAFSVIDGVVYDDCKSGSKTQVLQAWEYKGGGSVVVEPQPIKEEEVVAVFDKELFIREWYATGKPTSKKIPCTKTGRMVTMYSTNLINRVRKYGSVEALLENFVSKR